MRRILQRRPSPSMVVAIVALFVALGGTSVAATLIITGKNVKNGSLTGADIKRGSLTGKNVKNDSLGGKQIKESSLGKVPSAANADNAASAGKLGGQTAGAFQRTDRWVLIQGTAASATVLAQSGGFSAQRLNTGVYSVDTGQSVVKHPLSATLNLGGIAGFVTAAPCGGSANNPGGVNCGGANDTNHVLVQTLATNAAAADRTFYLVIGG
jgi:hypothetical protein